MLKQGNSRSRGGVAQSEATRPVATLEVHTSVTKLVVMTSVTTGGYEWHPVSTRYCNGSRPTRLKVSSTKNQGQAADFSRG